MDKKEKPTPMWMIPKKIECINDELLIKLRYGIEFRMKWNNSFMLTSTYTNSSIATCGWLKNNNLMYSIKHDNVKIHNSWSNVLMFDLVQTTEKDMPKYYSGEIVKEENFALKEYFSEGTILSNMMTCDQVYNFMNHTRTLVPRGIAIKMGNETVAVRYKNCRTRYRFPNGVTLKQIKNGYTLVEFPDAGYVNINKEGRIVFSHENDYINSSSAVLDIRCGTSSFKANHGIPRELSTT